MMNWKDLLSNKRFGQSSSKPINPPGSIRSDFEVDFDRIIFSSGFRKLQDKTQVIPFSNHDFVHNRLTHSLEVSSVGRSLGREAGKVILDRHPHLSKEHNYCISDFGAIVAAAALSHDIGNPPFGHSGEKAIGEYFLNGNGSKFKSDLKDKQWEDLIKFEGNANGFKLLTNASGSIEGGSRLTYATLSAFTKYPKESLPKYTDVKRIEEKKFGFFQSEKDLYQDIAKELHLERFRNDDHLNWQRHPLTYLVEAADDICYSIIDFEDGLRLGWIDHKYGKELLMAIIKDLYKERFNQIPSNHEKISYLRANVINTLINECVSIFSENEQSILSGEFNESLIDLSQHSKVIDEIKKVSFEKVYSNQKVLEIEAAGYEILGGLLDLFINAVNDIYESKGSFKSKKILQLIPKEFHPEESDDLYSRIMKVCEHISGMTDSQALSTYRIFKGIDIPNG